MGSARIDTLDTLLQQSQGHAMPELKTALSRLSNELKERTTTGSSSSYEFFVSAVQAVSKIKGSAHSDLRLGCLLESGLFFYRSGFAQAALETAAVANSFARRIGSKPWIRKITTLAGIIQAEGGNVAEAVVQHSQALQLARELGETDGEAAALCNLGTAFNYSGLHLEAVACLQRAITITAAPELVKYRAIAYCDLAQAFLALEQYERGFEAINCCLDIAPEPHDSAASFSRTIREFTYVQLALELGKLARAREHASLCWRYSQWGANGRCRTLADIAIGLCEVYGGDVSRGLATLEKALELSGDFIVSRIDVLNALAKAYEEVGRHDRALECLHQLLAFVRQAREQSISALLALPAEIPSRPMLVSDCVGMRPLELREANLRTKIAEREVINSRLEMLERLAITADLKEEASGEHGYRVGKLAGLIAAEINAPADLVQAIEAAARLHDIGKIAIPDRILFTSEELREAERHFVSSHAVIGAELLAKSNIPHLQLAELIARHHHEWWNGSGYPAKLSGRQIPLAARIVSIADVFDALTHGRPFASAWGIDSAIAEIEARRGTQFEPDLTGRFISLIRRLVQQHADLDEYLGRDGRFSPFLQARKNIREVLDFEAKRSPAPGDSAPASH